MIQPRKSVVHHDWEEICAVVQRRPGHHAWAFMVESNSRTISQDDNGVASADVGLNQGNAGEQPAVRSSHSVPFPHATVAHPGALVHLPQTSSATESEVVMRSPHPSRSLVLVAPVPEDELAEATTPPPALLDRFNQTDRPSGTNIQHSSDSSDAGSFGCADYRDSIEEDELYRSLADNELAVVPHGITLERYLALVIFKYAFCPPRVVTALFGCLFTGKPAKHTPAATPPAQLCAQPWTS